MANQKANHPKGSAAPHVNEAKEMGIDKVLVTILLDNIASQAVAIANGGVVTERTDERVFIWIDTKK